MDREGFRSRIKQYREAKGFNPWLTYWDWKQKYDSAPQPDNMPSQPQPDQPTVTSRPLDDRAHRWDNEHYVDPVNIVFDADRHRSWKEPAQKTFGKGRVKFTYRDFMKPADVKRMKFLQSIGRLGNTLKGASIFGEVIQNLFPSEEAELIEDLRVKTDKQNKWLTGQEDIPKYDEGGEVDQRQLILSRANKVATNYSDAKDFTLDPFNYAVRKIAKTLTGRGGISNCTLSATGWIDPNNQYMSAKNIFDNPGSGYTEIDKAYALPGDLLIAKNPKEGSYHTMLIESFNGDDPVLRYSRGGHNTEKNLVTGRSLEEYHRLDNEQGGNHTEDHYFRYHLPNEYWLPEIVVTPKK